jgi:hypothetical protein
MRFFKLLADVTTLHDPVSGEFDDRQASRSIYFQGDGRRQDRIGDP